LTNKEGSIRDGVVYAIRARARAQIGSAQIRSLAATQKAGRAGGTRALDRVLGGVMEQAADLAIVLRSCADGTQRGQTR
jgi:hypothetical protein